MKNYDGVLLDLREMKDEKYRVFNERIANVVPDSSIGVRIPQLRDYAKKFVRDLDYDEAELFRFPNEYLEIRMLKCLCVAYAKRPYDELVTDIRKCVPILNGWSSCDLFVSTLKVLKKHREEFLPELKSYAAENSEFSQRFALIVLLTSYMSREYLPLIFSIAESVDTEKYYVHMGAAWLIAEVLVRFYEDGTAFLKCTKLNGKTVNKAIQKARESYRLTLEQKACLNSLKRCAE